MPNRFAPNTPLIQKIATLLIDSKPHAALRSEEDLNDCERIARSIDHRMFKQAGLSIAEFDLTLAGDGGGETLLVIGDGASYYMFRLEYPNYCDDESDGRVNSHSGELTVEQVNAAVDVDVEAQVARLQRQINELRDSARQFHDDTRQRVEEPTHG